MRIIILLAVLSLLVSPAFAQKYISWEAENYDAISGDKFEIFEAPSDQPGNAAEGVDDYTVAEASGNAFIGSPNGVGNDGNAWVKYNFSIELDDWHFWGRVIAPSVADNSMYWAFDIDDAKHFRRITPPLISGISMNSRRFAKTIRRNGSGSG